MERPKTGHRRHETGSITVVDLIRRHQGPAQSGPGRQSESRQSGSRPSHGLELARVPTADEVATTDFGTGLLAGPAAASAAEIIDPDGAEHRPNWLARGAKLAGLGVGSLVLCGSVVLAGNLTHDRHPASAATSPSPTLLIGGAALRPDALAAQLGGKRASTTPARPASVLPAQPSRPVPHIATGTIAGPASPTPSAPATPSGGPVITSPLQQSPPSAEDVVRSFFRLLASQPSAAAQLVDPTLLEADPTGFAQSWSSMTRITVDSVTATPDGGVQAVVRMLAADGTWLRVVELLHVTGGDSPVIDGAELLSAQHG